MSTNKKSLTSRTISGFLWLLSSSGAQSILQLIVTAILARILVPEDFGVVAAAMVVILFTEMLYEMGIGPALVQMKEISDSDINTSFTFSVMLGILLAVIFYLINPFIAIFFDMPALTAALNVLVWIFPLRTISQISYSLLQRDMLFKKMAGLDLLSYAVGYGGVGISLAYFGYGLWSLIWANFVQAFLYSILLLIVNPRKIRLQLKLNVLKKLLRYGLGVTISQLFNFLARKVDYIVIGKVIDSYSLGIYSKAFALMNAPNVVAGKVMSKVMFVSYAKIQDSEERIARALDKSYSLLFLVSLPLSGISIVMAPEIINILLGPKWTEAVIPFQILVAFMFCRVGYKIGGTLLKSLGKVYLLSITQFIYFIIVLVGSYLGAQYGIEGVAVGVSIAILANFMMLAFYTVYLTKFSLISFLTGLLRSFVITSVIIISTHFLSEYLRSMLISTIITLSVSIILTMLIGAAIIISGSRIVLGDNGLWLRSKLIEGLSKIMVKLR
ncbi:MAG: lipopolysaccharide biosynthesis protein [Bacteroidota bacterium]